MSNGINTRRRLEKKRRKRLAEEASKSLFCPDDMIRLYVGILKHGCKPVCRQSLLSPDIYVIELNKICDYGVTIYTRDRIILRPVDGKNVRF